MINHPEERTDDIKDVRNFFKTQVLTVKDVSEILKMSVAMVRRLIRMKKLKAFQLEGRGSYRVLLKDIKSLVGEPQCKIFKNENIEPKPVVHEEVGNLDKPICVGELVRKLRLSKNLSPVELQAKCGMSEGQVTGIEKGIRHVGELNARRLGEIFGVPWMDFMEKYRRFYTKKMS